MSQTGTAVAMRRIAARVDGPRCCYCRVPTAATIEHVQARTKGGTTWLDNLRLACPYCNRRKGNRPIERFLAEKGFELPRPSDLPSTTPEMLDECFGWDRGSGLVATGWSNSKLEVSRGRVTILVRTDKEAEWMRYPLGDASSEAVAQASWDFLTRHDTPSNPKRQAHHVRRAKAARGRKP
jgi:hypothetical protein